MWSGRPTSGYRPSMSDGRGASSNVVELDVGIEDAFELVCDARRYPEWLVGAQHIRSVDPSWPQPGAAFRHRIGVGPLTVPGSTTVREIVRPRRLALAAGMGPLGEATVTFELREAGPRRTFLTVEERPSGGVAELGWRVARPVVASLLWGRNEMSLHTLADLAVAPA